ncbi:MAG: glycogen/starch/alpha-glucan phosphorylase [Verrucomicrobia bacterium]|nr:glycogen/starch/alpha-glucan phosphorylase [Verrucomicrobiota bacterium]
MSETANARHHNPAVRQAVEELGLDLDDLLEQEAEPGLGNGGLGRLAACCMESLSTSEIPVLTPKDFSSLQELQQRLLAFQSHYERSALPFNWTFTRRDLNALLAKIAVKRLALAA